MSFVVGTPATTVVVAVTLLLPEFGSALVELTVAVLLNVPAVLGRTTIATLALAPELRSIGWHVTTPPDCVHPAWLEDTNVTPLGSESVATTPVAGPGPLVVAVRV